jgi:hypothetical protein
MNARRTGAPFFGAQKRSAVALAAALLVVGLTGTAAAAGSVVSAYNFEGVDSLAFDPYTDAEGGQLHLLSGSPYTPTVNKQRVLVLVQRPARSPPQAQPRRSRSWYPRDRRGLPAPQHHRPGA